MRRRLYDPYMMIRKSVIVTILATLFVITLNAVLNYTEKYSFSIFWIYAIVPLDGIKPWNLVFKTSLSFLNLS